MSSVVTRWPTTIWLTQIFIRGAWWVFLAFFVLKVADKIGWSWWWVTSPLSASAVLFAVSSVGIAVIDTKQEQRRMIERLEKGQWP